MNSRHIESHYPFFFLRFVFFLKGMISVFLRSVVHFIGLEGQYSTVSKDMSAGNCFFQVQMIEGPIRFHYCFLIYEFTVHW